MTNKTNYKRKHMKIVFLAITLVIFDLLPFNIPGIVFALIITLPIVLFTGPYEKVDELAQTLLNKANKFTMLLVLFILMIFYVLRENMIILSADIFLCTVCIAIGFRSFLFICFDHNLSTDDGVYKC